MRFLFATDIHGDKFKYEFLLKKAPELGAAAVVVGGDIAPKSGNFHVDQPNFYKWLAKLADSQQIPLYTFLGNDDIKAFMRDFVDICNYSKKLKYLKVQGDSIEGVTYTMYNFVPDYPFGLKDWCKYDNKDFKRPVYWGTPVLSTKTDFKVIKDVDKHFRELSTIEHDLRNVPRVDMAFMHGPPAGQGLDVCSSGERVGSKAILEWIEREQPLLTMHGHIHESPRMSGFWKAQVGKTLCVQPGDRNFVLVDIEPDTGFVDVKLMEYR